MSSTPSSRTAGRGESRGEGSGERVRVMEIEREHGAERGGMDVEEVDMGLSPVGSVGGEVVGSQKGHSAATAKVWCHGGGVRLMLNIWIRTSRSSILGLGSKRSRIQRVPVQSSILLRRGKRFVGAEEPITRKV